VASTASGAPAVTITVDVNIAISSNAAGDLQILTGPAFRKGLEDI
jgi:hypothetical protein